MKKTWQGIKQLINLNSKNSLNISQLNYKGKNIYTNEGMANAFNDFFTNVGPELDKEIPICKKPGANKLFLNDRIPHSFVISPTNAQEIYDIIKNLD